jgi:hypothetical protein
LIHDTKTQVHEHMGAVDTKTQSSGHGDGVIQSYASIHDTKNLQTALIHDTKTLHQHMGTVDAKTQSSGHVGGADLNPEQALIHSSGQTGAYSSTDTQARSDVHTHIHTHIHGPTSGGVTDHVQQDYGSVCDASVSTSGWQERAGDFLRKLKDLKWCKNVRYICANACIRTYVHTYMGFCGS